MAPLQALSLHYPAGHPNVFFFFFWSALLWRRDFFSFVSVFFSMAGFSSFAFSGVTVDFGSGVSLIIAASADGGFPI